MTFQSLGSIHTKRKRKRKRKRSKNNRKRSKNERQTSKQISVAAFAFVGSERAFSLISKCVGFDDIITVRNGPMWNSCI